MTRDGEHDDQSNRDDDDDDDDDVDVDLDAEDNHGPASPRDATSPTSVDSDTTAYSVDSSDSQVYVHDGTSEADEIKSYHMLCENVRLVC